MWEKAYPPTLLMGMQIGAASGQNRMDDSPKRELTYDALIPLLGAYSDEGLIQKDTCTPPMFIEALFTIARTQKEAKYALKDE